MTGIAITGATGAMGRAVRERAAERADVTTTLLISRSPISTDDIPRVDPAQFSDGLADATVDVIVDFTVPSATMDALAAAVDNSVPMVVGTTGFSPSQQESLEAAAQSIPLLVAPNFSRGIQALIAGLEATIERLPGYDIELTETHHNRKRDAPSGTALRLLSVIEEARPASSRIHGRSGDAPRSSDEIGVHARRAGTIAGVHEVMAANNDEVIQLTHRAESRAVFANGALDAAAWLDGKSPGWYRFAEVVET